MRQLNVRKKDKPVCYGYRKEAHARVALTPGTGQIVINEKSFLDYFPRLQDRQQVLYPFHYVDTLGKYDVSVVVKGGGMTGTYNWHNFNLYITIWNDIRVCNISKASTPPPLHSPHLSTPPPLTNSLLLLTECFGTFSFCSLIQTEANRQTILYSCSMFQLNVWNSI